VFSVPPRNDQTGHSYQLYSSFLSVGRSPCISSIVAPLTLVSAAVVAMIYRKTNECSISQLETSVSLWCLS
jgi:hypothetical protein